MKVPSWFADSFRSSSCRRVVVSSCRCGCWRCCSVDLLAAQQPAPRSARKPPSRPRAPSSCSTSSCATRRDARCATCDPTSCRSTRTASATRPQRLQARRRPGQRRARVAGERRRSAARSEPAGQPGDDGVRQADGRPSAVAAGGAGLSRQQHGGERLGLRVDDRPAAVPPAGVHAGSRTCCARPCMKATGTTSVAAASLSGEAAAQEQLARSSPSTLAAGLQHAARRRRPAAPAAPIRARDWRRQREGADGRRGRRHPSLHQQHSAAAAGPVVAVSAARAREEPEPPGGRKTLLYFSEGLVVPKNLEEVFKTAISEANRANVTVYPVDARGLSLGARLRRRAATSCCRRRAPASSRWPSAAPARSASTR